MQKKEAEQKDELLPCSADWYHNKASCLSVAYWIPNRNHIDRSIITSHEIGEAHGDGVRADRSTASVRVYVIRSAVSILTQSLHFEE